jgi:hypothetical protein
MEMFEYWAEKFWWESRIRTFVKNMRESLHSDESVIRTICSKSTLTPMVTTALVTEEQSRFSLSSCRHSP